MNHRRAPYLGQAYEPLVIQGGGGSHSFRVEVVDGVEASRRGLMYRTELPEDAGMLFDFGDDGVVSMWMKNTYLALDIFFVRANGEIARVVENAAPESLAAISSGGPVRAVLELHGGSARRFGLRVGDVVRHRVFTDVEGDACGG